MAWGQYADTTAFMQAFKTPAAQGTCTMKLPGEAEPTVDPVTPVIPDPVAPEDPNCPRSKRDSPVDPKRQQDCSPAIATRCYDNSAGLYRNSRCPAGSACGQWT